MAQRITYEIVKQFFQDVFVPQLEQISGKLEELRVELRSIRTEKRGEAQTVLQRSASGAGSGALGPQGDARP
jgi:hypothetical protein